MKRGLLALTIALLGCSQSPLGGKEPTARLQNLACVAAGETITFDGSTSSDPDGKLIKYAFTIGHNAPTLVLPYSKVKYVFPKASKEYGLYYPVPVTLEVTDDDGNRSFAYSQVYVVDQPQQCEALNTQLDITTQDVVEEVVLQDVVEDVEDDIDIHPTDIAPQDVDVDIVSPDVIVDIKPDLPPGDCIKFDGPFHVEIFCLGLKEAEIDLDLYVTQECVVKDDFGIIEGTIDGSEISVSAPLYPEIGIEECSGPIDNPTDFALECATGCTAVFMMLFPDN